MQSHTITLQPPPNNGTGTIVENVAGTPLDGVQPNAPVIINPISAAINATTFGLIVAFVSAPNEITFAVKTLNGPTAVLVTVL